MRAAKVRIIISERFKDGKRDGVLWEVHYISAGFWGFLQDKLFLPWSKVRGPEEALLRRYWHSEAEAEAYGVRLLENRKKDGWHNRLVKELP